MLYDSLNLRPFQYLCMQQFFSNANRILKKSYVEVSNTIHVEFRVEIWRTSMRCSRQPLQHLKCHNYDYTKFLIEQIVMSVFRLAFKTHKDSIMMWIRLWFAYIPNLNISFPLVSAVNTKCIRSEAVYGNQTPLPTVQLWYMRF